MKLTKLLYKLDYYCPIIYRPLISIFHNLIYIFNNIKTNNSEYLKKMQRGKELLAQITDNDEYYYLINDLGIGDIVIFGMYSNIYKEKYNKKIAFVTLNYQTALMNRFKNIDKVIGYNKKDIDDVTFYILRSKENETNKYRYLNYDLRIDKSGRRLYLQKYTDYRHSMYEKHLKYIFNVSKDYPYESIAINKAKNHIEKLLKDNDIDNKSVLIVPFANTCESLSNDFWNTLSVTLCNEGYKVFTNIGNPKTEKPLDGSSSINLPLEEMLDIANKFKYVISIRCGFAEMISFNNPNMILIDLLSKYPLGWVDVNDYSSKPIKYVYIDDNSDDELINDILKEMEDN